MKSADLGFGRRACGYGVDGRVNRPVRGVAEFAGMSELADVEVCGHSASLNRRRQISKIMFWAGEAVLSRRSSECQCHLPEGGQMYDHAANRTHHPGAQFEQLFAECPDLSSRTAGVRGLQT